MRYSATSETTKEVCNKINFIFDIHFVETASKNGKTYVRGTCGKRNEFKDLKRACEENGYIYAGSKDWA